MKRILAALVAILGLAVVSAQALTYNRSSAATQWSDGVLWAADGSALAPSLSFYSNTDTGFYVLSGNVRYSKAGVDQGIVLAGGTSATQTIVFPAVATDVTSVTNATCLDFAQTVTGVLSTDHVIGVNPAAAMTAGVGITTVRVSGANTVTLRVCNVTAAPVDPASVNVDYVILR